MSGKTILILTLSATVLGACGGEAGTSHNENEVITTVILNFVPPTGTPVMAVFNDADGDGGAAPTIDPVNLLPGNYTLTIQFQNRLETPAEDITEEVAQEGNSHLLLFTGTAIVGPATSHTTGPLQHSYSDVDDSGLPIGLTNSIVASAGIGQLIVTLRHMPPEEPPVKSADTVDQVKSGGLGAIGGNTDAQVNFSVAVQ